MQPGGGVKLAPSYQIFRAGTIPLKCVSKLYMWSGLFAFVSCEVDMWRVSFKRKYSFWCLRACRENLNYPEKFKLLQREPYSKKYFFAKKLIIFSKQVFEREK